MRFYAPGLLDRNVRGPAKSAQPSDPVQPVVAASGPAPGAAPGPAPGASPATTSPSAPVVRHDAPPRPPAVLVSAANVVRRLFGPFPWIPPGSWDAETILRNEYLLFPGMIVWYALLPIGAVGTFLAGWLTLRRQVVTPVVLVSSVVVASLGAMYLTLNLSFRQRDFMFPFLLLTAVLAVDRLRDRPFWRRAYLAYWAMLVLLAVTHLTLRAVLA